jgi:hypothetical protein
MNQFSKKGSLNSLTPGKGLADSPPAKAACSRQSLAMAWRSPRRWASLDAQEQDRIGVDEAAITQPHPHIIMIRDIERHIIEDGRPMQNQEVRNGQDTLFYLRLR